MRMSHFNRAARFAVLLASTAMGHGAYAQDASVSGEAGETQAEEAAEAIVVTGSRIATRDIDAVAPVQAVSEVAIDSSGVTNIQDLLQQNPVFGVPGLSRTNSAFLTSGTGTATVDLRNLGGNRTLVLLNSRRFVAGVQGTSQVDLNVIPTQFLSRVDILTGGASSLYGSDAVAGVVNFVYKKNFEGVEGNAQYNITELGDTPEYQANFTVGMNAPDDRGNLMLHFGYSNQGGLYSRQRPNTRIDDSDTFALTGDPKDYGVPTQPFLSSFPVQGRFIAGGRTFTYDAGGRLRPCFSTNGGTAPASCGEFAGQQIGPDGFNRQAFRTLATPVERYLFAARGHYEVTDAIRLVAEGTYSLTTASANIEPFPLGSDNIFPDSGGATPIETRLNGAPVLNPLVPAAIAAAATDSDGDGLRDISFARRIAEVGNRGNATSRNLFRMAVGLEGDLFSNRFKWDLTYVYGRTTESQTSGGQVNVLNFREALAAIPDVDDVNNNGNRTEAVCASATARAQGCVPINIFGRGSITPAAVQYVIAEQSLQTRITQQVITGNISGTLFDLPAGPLGIAIGAEYRRETSIEDNDALTNAGLNGSNRLPDTRGSFDVKEIYGEVDIPILADTPFFHQLGLRAAGRISDYSTVGTVYTYNAGFEWAPIEDIRFRATYARSVRAPNIGELFTGPSQTFPFVSDPCAGIGPTGGGAIGDNCRRDAGVRANIAANGVFTLTQSDLQSTGGFDGGNPNLKEERSNSYTIGVVIAPRSIAALRGLSLTIDYYNISIQDAIVAPPRSFTLDQCYGQGNQDFCNFIRRRQSSTATNSVGSLAFVDAFLINGGELKSKGIDTVLNYRSVFDRVGEGGYVEGRVSYTRLLDGYVIPVPGADKDVFAGEYGAAKDRFTATMALGQSSYRVSFTGTYIGRSAEDDQFLAGFELAPRTITVPAEFYLDSQVSFRPSATFEFYVGVNNLLDNDAPRILSNTPLNDVGTDTMAGVYDVFGRRYYAGVRFRF